MKKTIAALLSTLLLFQACAFAPVSVRNRSTGISDRMEASSILLRIKIHMTVHDNNSGEDKQYIGWGSCSGVYIKDNVILTAAHCVKMMNEHIDVKELWVKRGDESARAVAFKVDPAADLALLYTPLAGTPIRLADNVVRGEDCWVVGNPLGLSDILTKGIVSQINLQSRDEKATFLVVDAVALPGNSGGPVVDSNCHLIGILTRSTSMLGFLGASGLGLVVDANTIRDFLASK